MFVKPQFIQLTTSIENGKANILTEATNTFNHFDQRNFEDEDHVISEEIPEIQDIGLIHTLAQTHAMDITLLRLSYDSSQTKHGS